MALQETADKILERIRKKNAERKRRIANQPPKPEPVNADPPVFQSHNSLAVLFSHNYGFSQGVAVGNILKVGGQGGWNAKGRLHRDISEQISQACDNVAAALGALRDQAGWNYVYLVKTYHTNLAETLELTAAHLQARMQKHRPVWTSVEVQALKMPGMVIEIEVEAYLERMEGSI